MINEAIEFFFPLFVGLAGSMHCLGMCGPLVVAYSLNLNTPPDSSVRMWPSGALHHLAFHMGRVTTYALLGAAASLLVGLAGFTPYLKSSRGIFTLTAGLAMIILGLSFMRVSLFSVPGAGSNFPFSRLINSRSPGSKYILGIFVGFLPCMLPWAMVMKASSSQNVFHGLMTMVLFGLGTIPVLFFTGFFASLLSYRLRILGERLAGLSVIAMGGMLVFKGLKYFLQGIP